MDYPETTQIDAVDEHFGQRIADPYRWLENDIRRDPDVAAWVEAQNGVSAPYLAGLPGRHIFHERLTALFDYERLTTPQKRGERYFFTRNAGLDNQAVLVVRKGISGADRVVIDPDEWSEDASTALAEWRWNPSCLLDSGRRYGLAHDPRSRYRKRRDPRRRDQVGALHEHRLGEGWIGLLLLP
jgi:prolyl oligopeptidase